MAIGLLGALAFLSPAPAFQLAGALLFLTHSILDGCDGELARLKFLESPLGRGARLLGRQRRPRGGVRRAGGRVELERRRRVAAGPRRAGDRRHAGLRHAHVPPHRRGQRPAGGVVRTPGRGPGQPRLHLRGRRCCRRSATRAGSCWSAPSARRSSRSCALAYRRHADVAGFVDVLLRGLALCGQAVAIGGVLFALLVLRARPGRRGAGAGAGRCVAAGAAVVVAGPGGHAGAAGRCARRAGRHARRAADRHAVLPGERGPGAGGASCWSSPPLARAARAAASAAGGRCCWRWPLALPISAAWTSHAAARLEHRAMPAGARRAPPGGGLGLGRRAALSPRRRRSAAGHRRRRRRSCSASPRWRSSPVAVLVVAGRGPGPELRRRTAGADRAPPTGSW